MPIFGYKLSGKHFLANIAVDEKTAGGITVPNRNPRKWRLPPDAYIGKVIEVGPLCELIKVGDIVTIQRWAWIQLDVDDEVLEAHEEHVLLVNGIPVNDIVAMEIEMDSIKAPQGLIVPDLDTSYEKKLFVSMRGIVIKSSAKELESGDRMWIKKANENQWKLGKNKLIFRWDDPNRDQMSNILCVDKKEKKNG